MQRALFAALALGIACIPAPGESKPREWQECKILEIAKPGESPAPVPTDLTGVRLNDAGTVPFWGIRVPALSPQTFWALAIEAPDGTYVATVQTPPKKGPLATITAGTNISCAVEKRTLHLRLPKGKPQRLRIRLTPADVR